METNYTITKSQVENIKLKFQNGMFANITLDYLGSQGRISIASDFGTWSNYWGACGEDFKKFLIGLDMYYFAGKVNEDRFFDHENTIKYLKQSIKENANNKYHKKEMLDQLAELKECEDEQSFVQKMYECDDIMNLEDGCPDMIRTISPSFKNFWERIWSVFVLELKRELETVSSEG